ncbi:MAG: TRAP transporter large permease subunit [Myxococcales bacterium]|nr:TRAP transporter large permease subunit [Myxococcales bacterium]
MSSQESRSPGLSPSSLLTGALGLVLLVVLVVGLAPNASTRVVSLGESVWPGYAAELRLDPEAPDCDAAVLARNADTCVDTAVAPAPEADPFADPAPEPDPFADPAPEPDPFADPAPKPPEPDPFADPPAEADPFADPAPKAADPFADPPAPTGVSCAAVRALADRCAVRWKAYDDASARLSGGVVAFRSLDRAVDAVALFPWHKETLVLLLLLGGLAASGRRKQIALREPGTLADHRLAEGAQALVHLAWAASCVADWRVQQASASESDSGGLAVMLAIGFGALALTHVRHLVVAPDLPRGSGLPNPLVIPLYAWMGALATVWFALEGHPSGQAIYVHKFLQIPSIYLGIGLYIWAGMILARTSLARRVFDVLLPWKLPPALLAWLVVVLAAVPTAYSGASGIFVIAAGAVIFERLTLAGAPPRLALAATAMSGSLGVVLRPCLVVVLVAVLNKSVTTDALFGWGRWVFALTAGLFLIAMLVRNDQPFERPDVGAATRASGEALRGLLPHALIGVGVLLAYRWLLGTPVTEHTAAWVLPGILLALALFEHGRGLLHEVGEATHEAAEHIGALLLVMAGSVGVGGVVERAELLALLPTDFGSPFAAMVFLVFVMVLVGMTMDALGAVILVSVTLAHVAEANGIDPVHFWMMVLCAFELGYLTPPVALNHLLAHQVIGEAADVSGLPAKNVFERYEHVLLPMVVMGTALVIVAFGPLLVG